MAKARQRFAPTARPRPLGERLREATVAGGIATVGGQLGQLKVHSGLRWATRAHEETGARASKAHKDVQPGDPPLVAHVAWTAGERLAVTGDSHQPCLCVWQRNESEVVIV